MTDMMFISELEPRLYSVRILSCNLFHVHDIKRPKPGSMCSVCCRDIFNNRFNPTKDEILVVKRGPY